MREGEKKIIDVLLYNEQGLSFTKIKDKSGLSPPSLTENLKRLNNLGFILRNDKTRKYRIPKGMFPFMKRNLKIEEKLMNVVNESTALFWGSLGYKHSFENNDSNHTEERIINRKEFVKKYTDYYNSLVLYAVWEILLFSYKNEDSNKIKEFLEDYFQPMLYLINEFIKNNDDVINVFDNGLESLRNNVEQLVRTRESLSSAQTTSNI